MKNNKVKVSSRFRTRKVDNSNLKNKSKKEYKKIIFLAIFLFAVFCGTSYALFSNVVKSTKTVEVTSGVFKVEFQESNSIKLNNASPVSDEVGMTNIPYTFTINNTGTLPAKYNISLEEDSTNTLDRKYIKYSIKEDNGEWSSPLTIDNGLMLTSNRLLETTQKTNYEIKMWLDENADNSVQGKTYQAKIVINSVQTNATLKDVVSPIIQLNGNSTINIEQNKTFNDPGISSIKDDEDKINTTDVTTRYEYFDGENTSIVENIDTSKIGTYYIYYEVRDSKNNLGTTIRIVNIYKKDTTPPTISLIGDEVSKLEYGALYEELGAVAEDAKDGSLTDKVVVVGTVNTKKEGTYIIKYLITDSEGNTASVARTVIVIPKTGTITAETSVDDTDNTKTVVDVTPTTNADTVKYAITTEDEKPPEKEFKTMEELEKEGLAEDGKILLTKNDTYYIWIKDSDGNIIKKKVTVTKIDETLPTCEFSQLNYVGLNITKEIELTCTDVADIKEKYLTDSMFDIEEKKQARISNISSPERIENGYKYKINIEGLLDGEFKISLKSNSISDKADNTNEKITSNNIKISSIKVENESINLDVSNKDTDQIKISGKNNGELTYTSDNDEVAQVTNEGVVKGIAPGTAIITVKESNGGAISTATVNVEKTLSATFEKNGVGTESISSTMKSCKLTATNPTTCNITGADINTKEGYSAIGWNTDKMSHTGSYDLELSENTTYYSITKKDLITLVAAFNKNGATLSPSAGTTTCDLGEVYNDEQQDTSCNVTLPEIIGSENTPIVVGFVEKNPSISEDSTILKPSSDITLTEKNNGHTWYAITKSAPITYQTTYDKNSVAVSRIGKTTDSCTIPETYNGIAQNKSCTVTLPEITTNTGYTAIGWNEDKLSHTGTPQNENIQLSSDKTYYAIASKDAITYTAKFVKSGTGVENVSSTSASCTISNVYNDEEQETTCNITLPNISVKSGYTAIGWSENQISHKGIEKGTTIALSDNTTYYSISKKDAITLNASFNENGASLASLEKESCTLDEVYNNENQATSCIITPPSIERENFTILGYDSDKNSKDPMIKLNENITLTQANNNTTWYAITKKNVNMTWVGNGAKLSSTQSSCTIWNSEANCSITSPTITRDDYKIIGFNTNSLSDESTWNQTTERSVTDSEKYYAITSKKLTVTFNKNNSISQTDENDIESIDENVTRSCTIKNLEETCSITSPKIVANTNTPNVIGYNEKNDEKTSTWNELTEQEIAMDKKYYAITKKDAIALTATFTKNGVGVNEIGSSKESCTISATYNGTVQATTCDITTPTITTLNGYSTVGWNTSKVAHDGIGTNKTISIDNDYNYYSISKKDAITLTATFVKSGVGVDKISSTSSSCVLEATYNDEIQKTTCNVASPEITVTGLYKALGWSQNQNATKLATSPLSEDDYISKDDMITLNQSRTFYSISKKDELILNASLNENGSTIASSNDQTCTLEEVYNNQERKDSCTFTIPTIERENFDIIGLNQDKDSHTNDNAYDNDTKKLTIDSNNNNKTWYAITKRNVEVIYDKNGSTSISKDNDNCTIWNSATSCQIKTPTIERKDFEILGWNIDKDANEEYENISVDTNINISDNMKYYAITRNVITNTYYLNGSLGQTNSLGTITAEDSVSRVCIINNRETTCKITSPAIVASYNTPIIVGYATSKDKTSSDWDVSITKDVSTSNMYYAITKKSAVNYSVNYNKQGLGVTSIAKTSDSCTIPEVYNGAIQTTSCTINSLPSINVSSGYSALGWSQNKDTENETNTTDQDATNGYIGLDKSLVLTKNISLYAISKKNAITLTSSFYKNGAASQTLVSDGVISAKEDNIVRVTCVLDDAYNNNIQDKSCNITAPIINASTNTPDVIGYALQSDALLSDLKPNTILTLTKDVNYYAITKKNAITLDATWNENNSKLSSTSPSSCELKAVYNGVSQAKSCEVTAPSVTAPENTPTFKGFSSDHNDTNGDDSYSKSTSKLTLTSDNTGRTWYPITEKAEVKYDVNYQVGSNVKSISANSGKCTIPATYNGSKQTTTCIIGEDDKENNPTITSNTGYTSLGWSQIKGATVGSPVVVLTKNSTTFYANASANNYNINYYSDNALIGKTAVTYDKSFTLTTIKELNLTKRGYTFKNWLSNGVSYADGATISQNLASEEGSNVVFNAVWKDEEKPTCRFVSVGSTTTQNTTTVKVECTDSGSGVAMKNLTTSAFSVSDSTVGEIISVGSPVAITDGYSYEVVVKGKKVGNFNVTIAANSISDNSGNTTNSATTPTTVNVSGRTYSIKYQMGSNVTAIGSTLGSCTTTGSSIVCNVVLPSITAQTGYTVDGWNNSSNITTVGSNYELNENNNGSTLTAKSSDITNPTCSITGNPTSWTQSATLTVSGSDTGSGLNSSPYSWTSNNSGFSTTTTKVISANGTYIAYVKDVAGNVGSCSTAVSKIDTTKPSCTFGSPSDTSIVAGNTATLKLTCTDTQSLINTNSLTTSSFTSSNVSYGKVTNVTAPTAVSNGYSYDVTVTGVAYGDFNISLNDSAITDNANNKNNKTTSSNMTGYNKATVGTCTTGLTYNGGEQTIASGGTGISYSNNKRTNAGNQDVTMTPNTGYKFSDEAANKTLSACSIAQRNVTYTANSDSMQYKGQGSDCGLNATGAVLTSGSLVSGHTATTSTTGSIYNVGSVIHSLNSVTIKDASSNDVTSNYNITKVNGTFTITKKPITCTASTDSKEYNGSALTNSTGSCDSYGKLETATFNNSGSITNVGSTNNNVTSVTMMSGSVNTTSNYTITTKSGTLTVSKRSITCSATNQSKAYDGSKLNADSTGSCDSKLLSTHKATFSNSGSIGPDVSTGTKTLNSVTIKDSSDNDVTSNYNVTKNNGSLAIIKASSTNPTLTGYSGAYDGASHTITVTGGSGGTIQYSTDNSTWSTTKPTRTDVGTTKVYVKVFGDSNHNDTTSISANIAITKANSTINLTTGGTYNGNPISASASGVGTVTISYYSNSNCTTGISTPTDAGQYYVKATSAGNSSYNGATTSCTSHVVSKASSTNPTLTGYSGTYDGDEHSVGVTGGAGGTIDYSTDNSNWSTTKPTRTDAGTTTVYVKIFGDSNHNDTTSTTADIKITKAESTNPTLTGYNGTYDGNAHSIGVTGGAGGTINYSTDNSNWSTTKPTRTDVGTTTVYVKVVGDLNHNDTSSASVTIVVTKASSSVTLTAKSATYTGSAISANSASGIGTISYKYYTNNTCTTQTSTTTGASSTGSAPIDAGTYYVKATSTGNTNYNGATSSCYSHTIKAKSVAVTWGSTTSFVFNGSSQAPTATGASGISGETLNISRTTETATGNYTSTASLSSVSGGRGKTENYTLTGTTKAFSITGITRTITFNANGNTISKSSDSCTTSGSSYSCNITSPTITAPSATPSVIGFSTASGTHSNEWSQNTAKSIDGNTTKSWYAQTKHDSKTLSTTLSKSTGVSSIGATTMSCTIDATYNGTGIASVCSTNLPSITPITGYGMAYWQMYINDGPVATPSPGDEAPIYDSNTIATYTAFAKQMDNEQIRATSYSQAYQAGKCSTFYQTAYDGVINACSSCATQAAEAGEEYAKYSCVAVGSYISSMCATNCGSSSNECYKYCSDYTKPKMSAVIQKSVFALNGNIVSNGSIPYFRTGMCAGSSAHTMSLYYIVSFSDSESGSNGLSDTLAVKLGSTTIGNLNISGGSMDTVYGNYTFTCSNVVAGTVGVYAPKCAFKDKAGNCNAASTATTGESIN